MVAYSELQVAKSKVIGTSKTIEAVRNGKVERVYIAQDASEHVVKDLQEVCSDTGTEVVYVDSMAELGKACGINLRAASVGILN